MGIPSVIVVASYGDVIVDLDSTASDGYAYGAANEGFDDEDGAGMWQQAGEANLWKNTLLPNLIKPNFTSQTVKFVINIYRNITSW
eukprot:scaffold108261_cov33-Cyclotella_meneghiniana.AAC.1